MATEVAFTLDFQVWIPILIAAASLVLSFRQMRRANGRDSILELEKKIDRSIQALAECESNLKQCGREKDELRREKFELLQQIATLVRPVEQKQSVKTQVGTIEPDNGD